jgi:hypothetical protein
MFALWSSPKYTPIKYTCPIKKTSHLKTHTTLGQNKQKIFLVEYGGMFHECSNRYIHDSKVDRLLLESPPLPSMR